MLLVFWLSSWKIDSRLVKVLLLVTVVGAASVSIGLMNWVAVSKSADWSAAVPMTIQPHLSAETGFRVAVSTSGFTMIGPLGATFPLGDGLVEKNLPQLLIIINSSQTFKVNATLKEPNEMLWQAPVSNQTALAFAIPIHEPDWASSPQTLIPVGDYALTIRNLDATTINVILYLKVVEFSLSKPYLVLGIALFALTTAYSLMLLQKHRRKER